MDSKKEKNYTLRHSVLIYPAIIFLVLIGLGYWNQELFVSTLWSIFEIVMNNFGWFVSLTCVGLMIFLAYVWFSPIGKIRFGGKDAKPKYSTWEWWAVSLCAGISTGTLFWGAAEPLTHAAKPALEWGIQAGSSQAITKALSTVFLHWTIVPYAIIVAPGLVLGYAYYNMNKPYTISSGLTLLMGDKALGRKTSRFVDGINAFAITGGVAGALGYGVLQIGNGMNQVFGIEPGPVVWISIAAVIIVTYCVSSIIGLDKGIKWLSDKNAWIFIFLLIFVFIFGPTSYIVNITTQAIGQFVSDFFPSMLMTSPSPDGDMWSQWWSMYYFIDWMAFGPIVGLFLIKLCYGRTIKEFITVNLIFPALFGLIWFGVFGGLALNLQYVQGVDLVSYLNQYGAESLLLKIFEYLPFANILKPFLLIVIGISFVTLANSMTSTVSLMSIESKERIEEAPMHIKLFWGLLMGGTAIVFISNGGLDGAKVIKALAGLPIIIFPIMMAIGFLKHMSKKIKKEEVIVIEEMESSE